MKRISHLVIMGVAASIALATIPLRSARAQVSGTSSTSSSSGDPVEAKPGDYNRLLRELREEREHMRAEERRHEEEEAAERKRIDALEKEVGAINSTNAQLQQNQAALQLSPTLKLRRRSARSRKPYLPSSGPSALAIASIPSSASIRSRWSETPPSGTTTIIKGA